MDHSIKPVVFFSHSSHDAALLHALKEKFVDKTGGTISVFLSSDDQSIPFGRNWIAALGDALKFAKIAFVFITQSSIKSTWVFFEAGSLYARDIKVIPIGFLNYDLSNLSPPLSLLQGFNITSWNSLNNIIQIVNDEFGYKHKLSFQDDDFNDIVKPREPSLEYNAYSQYVSRVWVPFTYFSVDQLRAILELLAAEKIDYYLAEHELVVPEISIYFHEIYVRHWLEEAGRGLSPGTERYYLKVDFEYDCPGGLLDNIFSVIHGGYEKNTHSRRPLTIELRYLRKIICRLVDLRIWG